MMKYICKSTRIFETVAIILTHIECKNKFQHSFVNKLDYVNTCQLWSMKSKGNVALHEITCRL